jgi:integrase
MKATSTDYIYERGKHGIKYVRRRIPTALRLAYPPKQTDIVRSLGTADLREAKSRAHIELAKIEAEFQAARNRLDLSNASMNAKRVSKLTDEQLLDLTQFWSRQVLLADEKQREEGLDDEDFDALGEHLTTQRQAFGQLLARGKWQDVLPAMSSFLFLCGVDFVPDEAVAKRAGTAFLRTVVETFDNQLARQRGEVVRTDIVAPAVKHPLEIVAPERAPADPSFPTWDKVFQVWCDFVANRPQATRVAAQTAWKGLITHMEHCQRGRAASPALVTPQDMAQFVDSMQERGLAVKTINERLRKVRTIFKVAKGKMLLSFNPALETLGVQESGIQKRKKRRLPFDQADLDTIFGSEIFLEHKRSRGQSGEASYWIPVLMYYTGARPEEIGGLALSDLRKDSQWGYHFVIVDRFNEEDDGLFESEVPESHRRTLKSAPSERRVPVASQLIEMGLLRYVEWLRAKGEVMFFPSLKKDWHGKLTGAFSKFFGRYKVVIGIEDPRKVLYSFRHTMKDMLEAGNVPSKYLRRLLGHTTGDGAVTDGYGSDLPLGLLVQHFRQVPFHPIPALPWEPGKGAVSLGRSNKDAE